MTKINKIKQRQLLTSLGIMAACLGLIYVPLPGFDRKIIVVSGTELQEPLYLYNMGFVR